MEKSSCPTILLTNLDHGHLHRSSVSGSHERLALGFPTVSEADFTLLVCTVGAIDSEILGSQFKMNLRDWPRMWLEGEYLAARYQLVQLVRRLKNARDAQGRSGPDVAIGRLIASRQLVVCHRGAQDA